jgi:methyl-accepting chemotaxis protein
MVKPSRFPFTLKLTLGILAIVILTVLAITLINLKLVKTSLHTLGEKSLSSLVQGVSATLEMQRRLLDDQTRADLGLFLKQVHSRGFPGLNRMLDVDMEVSEPGRLTRSVTLPVLQISSHDVTNTTDLVDGMEESLGVQASVYQFHENLLVNVSTSLRRNDGSRTMGHAIGPGDPLYQATVERGESYAGILDLDGELFQTASMPLKDFSGRLLGVISASRKIVTPQLTNALQAFAIGGKGEGLLVGQDGRSYVHTGSGVGKTVTDQPFWPLLRETRSGLVRFELDGRPRIGAVERFEPWGLSYLFSMDADEMAHGLDRTLARTGLIMTCLAVVLVVSVVVLMVRMVTRPLQELSRFTEEVSRGNYDASIAYPARDVIAETIAAVQRMVAEIRTRLAVSEGILKGIPLPCAMIDRDHRISWFNPQMLEMLGKYGDPSGYLGQPPGQFFWNDPTRQTNSDMALRLNRQQSEEISYCNARGENKIIQVSSTPFQDMEGTTLGTLSVWYDLTGYLEQKERIQEQQRTMTGTAAKAEHIALSIAKAAADLSAQVELSRKGSELQLGKSRETACAMVEMNGAVLEVARNASGTSADAEKTRQMALEGAERVRSVTAAIRQLECQSVELKAGMAELSGQAVSIGRIMQVIEDIADQTNLLALNAAIEAARAGDAGRGFAVVADEVRKLAEKTMAATREVDRYITTIQVGTRKNTEATEAALGEVLHSTGLAESSGKALEEIVLMAERTAGQVRSIAAAAEQQSTTSEQINRATEEISAISSENAQAMDECSAAVRILTGLSSQLEGIISAMHKDQGAPA